MGKLGNALSQIQLKGNLEHILNEKDTEVSVLRSTCPIFKQAKFKRRARQHVINIVSTDAGKFGDAMLLASGRDVTR